MISIDTTQIDEDLFYEYANSVYCTTCKSCGELGCECWAGCSALYCKYGDYLCRQYEELKKDSNTFFTMLVELGVENPYQIDIERIKEIANKIYPFKDSYISSGISYYFNQLKDPEIE